LWPTPACTSLGVMPTYITACSVCVHYKDPVACAAYSRIPDRFWHGAAVHLDVEADQVGSAVLTALDQNSVEYLVQVRLVPRGTKVSIQEDP
jgi:hypothetical protein